MAKATEYYNLTQPQKTIYENPLIKLYKNIVNNPDPLHPPGYMDYITALMSYLDDYGIRGVDIYISHNSSMTDWKKFVYNSRTRIAEEQ